MLNFLKYRRQKSRSLPILDIMQFTLVYQGPLSATGNSKKTAELKDIRTKLSPQLEHLWKTHPSIKALQEDAYVDPNNVGKGFSSASAMVMSDTGFLSPRQLSESVGSYQSLINPIDVGEIQYLPIVRSSLHLSCDLKIRFLRQDDPGALITQGGDLDNRIKTLLDALRMPTLQEQQRSSPDGMFFHCLMESDTLVSSLNVETDRLLFAETEFPNEVFLMIDVSLRVLKVTQYNVCLL